MSYLVRSHRADRSDTIQRFDPVYWNTNFDLTTSGSVVAVGTDGFDINAVIRLSQKFISAQWFTSFRFDHPLYRYEVKRDYTGCIFEFDINIVDGAASEAHPLAGQQRPTLEIETYSGDTYFVTLWEYRKDPENTNIWSNSFRIPFTEELYAAYSLPDTEAGRAYARVPTDDIRAIKFGALPRDYMGGWGASTVAQIDLDDTTVDVELPSGFAPAVSDRVFIWRNGDASTTEFADRSITTVTSLGNNQYCLGLSSAWNFFPDEQTTLASGAIAFVTTTREVVLPTENTYTWQIRNIRVSGSNTTLLTDKRGIVQPEGIELGMTDGYDNAYNLTPQFVARRSYDLGFRGDYVMYVGISHFHNFIYKTHTESHTGDNSEDTFDIGTTYRNSGTVKVYLDDVLQTSGYTLVGNRDGTGNAVFDSAPGNSVEIDIVTEQWEIDKAADALNIPTQKWTAAFAAECKALGFDSLWISVSFEILDQICPPEWRQYDSEGYPALTGWKPPSTLVAFTRSDVLEYLGKIAKEYLTICKNAGLTPHYQIGEPWWWIMNFVQTTPEAIGLPADTPVEYNPVYDINNLANEADYFPTIYDTTTVAAATAAGVTPPEPWIRKYHLTDAEKATQQDYLDFLRDKLGDATSALLADVKATHADVVTTILIFTPVVVTEATVVVDSVTYNRVGPLINAPLAEDWGPAVFDFVQIEDYDWIVNGRFDKNKVTWDYAANTLGYPTDRTDYFVGFVLNPENAGWWALIDRATEDALLYAPRRRYWWSREQVFRDGIVYSRRIPPQIAAHSGFTFVGTIGDPTGPGEGGAYGLPPAPTPDETNPPGQGASSPPTAGAGYTNDNIEIPTGTGAALAPVTNLKARRGKVTIIGAEIDLLWDTTHALPTKSTVEAAVAAGEIVYEIQILGAGASGVRYAYTVLDRQSVFSIAQQNDANFSGAEISLRVRPRKSGHVPGDWLTLTDHTLTRDYGYIIAAGGQSNMDGHFSLLSGIVSSRQSWRAMRQAIADALDTPVLNVAIVNIAVGGTAAEKAARDAAFPTGYWYDVDGAANGPILTAALDELDDWPQIDAMVWSQGETDIINVSLGNSHDGESDPTIARWKTATEAVFAAIRSATDANLPIVFQGQQKLFFGGTEVHGTQRQELVNGQKAIVGAQTHTYFGIDTSDYGTSDMEDLDSQVHFNPTTFQEVAQILGGFVGQLLNGDMVTNDLPDDNVAAPTSLDAAYRGGGDSDTDQDVIVTWTAGTPATGEQAATSYEVRNIDPAPPFAVVWSDSVTSTQAIMTEAEQRAYYTFEGEPTVLGTAAIFDVRGLKDGASPSPWVRVTKDLTGGGGGGGGGGGVVAPASITAIQEGDGDIVYSWTAGTPSGDEVDADTYTLEIIDIEDGSTVLRTVSAISGTSHTWTVAEQQSDYDYSAPFQAAGWKAQVKGVAAGEDDSAWTSGTANF